MQVIFIYGPAASGKYTIGSLLSTLTGIPLFHNHLAVDAAKSLFEFGTVPFNNVRAAVWRSVFSEAAKSRRSFIFTFNPEASVDPSLIEQMIESIHAENGAVRFVELTCSHKTILERLGNASRTQFGKLTDPDLYQTIQQQGGFEFPPLPAPIIVIDTDELTADRAAEKIAAVLRSVADKT